MSNVHASKTHGMSMANTLRPKSKMRVRRNKAKANARKAERRKITGKI